MPGIYPQKGPRAHHFAGFVSFFIGVSVFFEYYATNIVFESLTNRFVDGKHMWGFIFMFLGLSMFQRVSIIWRGLTEILLCFVWTTFGLYSLYLSLLSPQWSHQAGSVFGILSIAMAILCILASSNLRRDFYYTDKAWIKNHPQG
jgi:hypothetical protein